METDMGPIPPPKGLTKAAAVWWDRLLDDYDLDNAGQLLLGQALECFDRVMAARRRIKREGLLVPDRFKTLQANPAVKIENDSKALFLRYFRALNLDIEPLRDGPGRPPGS